MGNPAAEHMRSQRQSGRCEYIDLFCKEVCFTFTSDGYCADISTNWPAISGYEIRECLHHNIFNLIRKIDQKKIRQLVEAKSLTKKVRFRLRHQAGHWDWYEINAVKNTDGGFVHLVAAKISDEVSKESELHRASLEAELALKGQSEFFAHISHELRTPLNAIVGFSQMMHQEIFGEIDNPRYKDYVALLEKSGQDLLSKINDLLEISSLCAGIDKLTETTVSLNEIIKSVVEVHSRELFSRHLHISIDIASVSVIADRPKLMQTLSHLLKNAMRYSPENGSIKLSATIADDESLVVTLSDQGPGFSAEQLNTLREQSQHFSLLERHRRMMGFGIPLADELIRLHGGKLSYKNAKQGGAEVSFTLPAKRIIAVREQRITKPLLSESRNFSSVTLPNNSSQSTEFHPTF